MRIRPAFPMSMTGVLFAAALAAAQPPPVTQPPAQDPTPVPAAKPPAVQKPAPKVTQPAPGGRMTTSEAKFTGCLQRAEQSGPAQSAEGARLTGGFVLTRATTAAAKDSPASAAGTKDYRLVAKDDSIKLAEHVGHEVEVSGRISLEAEPPSQTSTESGTSVSRPSGSTGVSGTPSTGANPAAPAVTLTVTSVKMLASSCATPAS